MHSDTPRSAGAEEPAVALPEAELVSFEGRLPAIARSRHHVAFDLGPSGSTARDWDLLAAAARSRNPTSRRVFLPEPEVSFLLHNDSDQTFLHPEPLRPSALRIRSFDRRRRELSSTYVEDLLPIAIGPGDVATRRYRVALPDPGIYWVLLTRAAEPDVPLAATRLHALRPIPANQWPEGE